MGDFLVCEYQFLDMPSMVFLYWAAFRVFALIGKKMADVGCAGEFDVVVCLKDFSAVEGFNKANLFKGRTGFTGKLEGATDGVIDLGGKLGIWGCHQNEVTDLLEQKNGDTFIARHTYVAFMGSGFESESGQDRGNVHFPEMSGFRVALEGMQDWENLMAVNFFVEMGFMPFDSDHDMVSQADILKGSVNI
jgi:hypothetical protein